MRTALTVLLLAALLPACSPRGPGSDGAKGKAANAPAPMTAASAPLLLLAPEDLRTVGQSTQANGPVISGTIQPERRADLRAEIAGVVLQVLKDNGQSVRKGELLVRLDDAALRDTLASAEDTARAAAQTVSQAERHLQRQKSLQAQGMISMQALDEAEVRRSNAQSDLLAAKARVAAAQQQLQRTEVRAPFDGVLSERKASVGDTAQVGKELLKVFDPRSMRFEGLVSADRMQEIKVGQAVGFHVNGYPDADYVGQVQRIDSSANATTRQVEVMVSFPAGAARPSVAGLFAEGRVQGQGEQVLTVPESAVVRTGEAASVWRVGENTLSKVAVKLGERDARRGTYPVLEGLKAGDRVLANPGSSLVDGQRFELAAKAAQRAASQAAGG